MKKFLKTLGSAALGGAAAGAASLGTLPDPKAAGKAAAVGAIVGAAGLWVRQPPPQLRGPAGIGFAILGSAAQAVAQGGATDPHSLATIAITGAITGILSAAVRSPNQAQQ